MLLCEALPAGATFLSPTKTSTSASDSVAERFGMSTVTYRAVTAPNPGTAIAANNAAKVMRAYLMALLLDCYH